MEGICCKKAKKSSLRSKALKAELLTCPNNIKKTFKKTKNISFKSTFVKHFNSLISPLKCISLTQIFIQYPKNYFLKYYLCAQSFSFSYIIWVHFSFP